MRVKDYTFENEPVLMDFHFFQGCTFRRCRLVYCGYSPLQFEGCRFDDCRWEFSGPAMTTLHVLSSLNHRGGDMGRLIVKQALALIQNPPPAGGATSSPGPTSSPPPPPSHSPGGETFAPSPPPTPPAAGA